MTQASGAQNDILHEVDHKASDIFRPIPALFRILCISSAQGSKYFQYTQCKMKQKLKLQIIALVCIHHFYPCLTSLEMGGGEKIMYNLHIYGAQIFKPFQLQLTPNFGSNYSWGIISRWLLSRSKGQLYLQIFPVHISFQFHSNYVGARMFYTNDPHCFSLQIALQGENYAVVLLKCSLFANSFDSFVHFFVLQWIFTG